MKPASRLLIVFLILILFTSGCQFRAGNLSNIPTAGVEPTLGATRIIPPTYTPDASTATPSLSADTSNPASPTLAPTVVITPQQPATVTEANVRLRLGPSLLSPTIIVLDRNTPLTVLAKAAGDDWLLVETRQRMGWIATENTDLSPENLSHVAIQPVPDMVTIHGQVADSKGNPMQGIQFMTFQGKEESKPPFNLANSTASGDFYLYLPAGSSGTWRGRFNDVSCKSPIVDKYCRFTGAFVPRSQDVVVPTSDVLTVVYYP
jgi:hypothetical protein